MNVERYLRLIAGAIVMATVSLGYWVSPYWLLFTGFVGLNLFQSAFTSWCPMMTFLRKLGVKDFIPKSARTVGGTMSIALLALVFLPALRAQDQTQHRGSAANQSHGMPGGHGPQDMKTIHSLLNAHQQVTRTVTKLSNGIQTLTESDDAQVRAMVRQHVAAMYQRLANKRPIRGWDPLFAELFKQADKIKMVMVDTAKGVSVTETSADPWVAKLLHAHAEAVSEFVKDGNAVMHKEHPLPNRDRTNP